MAFKLAVGNVVEFTVEASINDKGQQKKFKLVMQGDRIIGDEIKVESSAIDAADDKLGAVSGMLKRRITGWVSQDLVIDDASSEPAAFSAEALDAVLSVPGMPMVIWRGYMSAQGAREGN